MSTADPNATFAALQQLYLTDPVVYNAINVMAENSACNPGFILGDLAASGFAPLVLALAEVSTSAKNEIVRREMDRPALPGWMRDIIMEAKQQ